MSEQRDRARVRARKGKKVRESDERGAKGNAYSSLTCEIRKGLEHGIATEEVSGRYCRGVPGPTNG